jgi:O-antigen ligase
MSIEYEFSETTSKGESTSPRLALWQDAFTIVRTAPIIGHGTGSTASQYGRIATHSTTIVATRNDPHNQIFAVAIQLGGIGVVILLLMWASHLLMFRNGDLVAWVGSMVVLYSLVGSLFNSHLFDFTTGWLYAFGVGVAGGRRL